MQSKSTGSIIFFIFLFCGLLRAGVETSGNRIFGSGVVLGGTVGASDNNLNVAGAKVAAASGKIIFSIDKASTLYVGADFTVKVGVKITSIDINNVQQVINTVLEVNYDNALAYTDKSVYVVNGSHYLTAEITSIKDAGGADIPPASIPQNLSLEAVQTTERYYEFEGLTFETPTGHTFLPASNEIDVYWDVIPGAEEYELEWTYVNNYDGDGGVLLDNQIFWNFRNNSTRIRLSENHHRISVIFDQGYVVYRVRGVGRSFTDLSKELFGMWSADETGDFSSNYIYPPFYGITSGYEKNKNWQYSASFAEEGKKKEVVSYFDGSLRNRQSVTKTNTENQTIVGETIYDHQGRGAIQVLPTPNTDNVDFTAKTTIKFFPDYNKSLIANLPYSRLDFDVDGPQPQPPIPPGPMCNAPTGGMRDAKGSSNYYSSWNPNLSGVQGYVPDAKLFPFTQIEYTPDNTGRIRRQSGVGEDHKLGTGRETKYFYGQPEQVQLDRMFGSEVGDFTHYKKNMVVDANGQISVSYLDQQGRVIATSLAGNTPDNVVALSAGSSPVTVNYLKADGTGDAKNKIQDDALIFSKELLVATAGPYEFTYDVTLPQFTPCTTNTALCYDCNYDLEISVKDECGVDKFTPVLQPVGNLVNNTGTILDGKLDNACSAPITFSKLPPLLTATLAVGNYTVYKKLKISQAAADAYVDDYIASSTCLKPFSSFTVAAMANIDTNACNIDCDQCVALLGDYSAHSDANKADPTHEDYEPAYDYMTLVEYDKAKKDCKAPCQPANLCESQYQTLLADVSPSGQYAKYVLDADGNATSEDRLSLYNINNSLPDKNGNICATVSSYWRNPKKTVGTASSYFYYDEDGITVSKILVTKLPDGSYYPAVYAGPPCSSAVIKTLPGGTEYIYPQELKKASDFIDLFSSHPEWAKSLVEYHPEYKYYEWCIKNNDHLFSEVPVVLTGVSPTVSYTSDEFDDLLRSKNTYQGALDAGLLDVPANSGDLLSKDPYFNSGTPSAGQGQPQSNAMANVLSSYLSTGKTIKEAAASAIRCGTTYYGTTCNIPFGSGGTLPADVLIRDKEWVLYRTMYLAEKQKFQQKAADVSAKAAPSRTNGCIGIKNGFFNPWNFGSFNNWQNNASDPCGFLTWQLYKNKTKRFSNGSDIIPGVDPFAQTGQDAFKNYVNYNMYLKTGQCPATLDIGFLLDDLLRNNNLLVNTDLKTVAGFTKNLYDLLDPSHASFINFHWVPTISASGTSLSAQFNSNSVGGATAATLTLNLPSGTWADVIRLSRIRYGGIAGSNSIFVMDAFLANGPGQEPIKVTVNGTISITTIDQCSKSAPLNCGPSQMALNLQNLFNALKGNGDFVNNPVNLLATPAYSLFGNNNLVPYTTLTWSGSTGTGVSLTVATGNTATLTCTFNFAFNNAGHTMSEIQFFANIRPHPSNPNNFLIDAWVLDDTNAGGHFEPMTVSTNGCYNFKECVPTPNVSCTGPEYNVNEGLLAGLNTFAGQGQLLNSAGIYLPGDFAAVIAGSSCPNPTWKIKPGHLIEEIAKTVTVSIQCNTQACTECVNVTTDQCITIMSFDTYTTSPKTFADIRSFSRLSVPGGGNGQFTLMAHFADGTSHLLNCSTTCVVLKPCEPCDVPVVNIQAIVAFEYLFDPCSRNESDPLDLPAIPYKNPCVERLLAIADANAKASYAAYIKSEKQKFREAYLEKCKEAIENFSMMYMDKEYHVTLYYYDQAGSLIKTVPPAGVVLVTDAGELDQITADRKANKQTFFTKHTLQTKYEYNSLGQLLRQATPDNELMNKWALNGAALLPPASNIYGIAFKNGDNGYVVGDDGSGNGVIYTTTDGGATWSPVSKVGIGNLKDVQFVGPVGYAISEEGYLVKTDGGANWNTIASGTNQKLNDLYFSSATSGVIIGNGGVILKTTDGCSTWTPAAVPPLNPVVDYYDLHFLDNIFGYIAGDKATVITTEDGGATWTNLPNDVITSGAPNARLKFNAIHYVPIPSGTIDVLYVAGVDPATSTGFIAKASVDRTIFGSASTTWSYPTVSPAPTGAEFKTIFAVNETTVYAAGTNGNIYRSTSGTTFTKQPVTGLTPATAELTEITFPDAVNPLQGYATAKNGQLVKSNVSGTTWTASNITLGTQTNISPLNGLYFESAASGYAAGNGGTILSTTNSAATWTSLTNTVLPELKATYMIPGSSVGYAVGKNAGIVKTTDGGSSWTSINTGTGQLNGVVFENINDGIAVGDAGIILKINGAAVNPIFETPAIAANLNAVTVTASGNYIAVGNAGAIAMGTFAGAWTSAVAAGAPDLNSVYFTDDLIGYACGNNGVVVKTINGGATWGATGATGVSAALHNIYFKDLLTGYVMGDAGTILKTIDAGLNWSNQTSPGTGAGNIYAAAFTGNGQALLAGTSNGAGTNNLEVLKDESFDYSTRFYYDRLGRLIVSENTKQFNKTTKAYSYTVYDALGRISEVGEIATASDIAALAGKHGVIAKDADYAAWLSAGTKTEITKTVYDYFVTLTPAPSPVFAQENLRTRVSAISIDEDGNGTNEHSTYFSYDIHGNVKTLLQNNPSLAALSHQYKRTDYEYDLVSGNVNAVHYQNGQQDAFHHRYEYDADNRITNVFTSSLPAVTLSGVEGWDQDAKYFYYLHGPLARTELGDLKVNAMDYAYTIQGWIKGVNSDGLKATNDIGKDGEESTLNVNKNIGRDAFGYSLNYFNTDYAAIKPANNTTADNFVASVTASAYSPNLYNGNISSMVSTITDPTVGATYGTVLPQLTAYKYDQLNRIKEMKAYRGLASNSWAAATSNSSYDENFSYDANGNILTLSRNGVASQNLNMDNLTYKYKNKANGYDRNTNQLVQVLDAVGSSPYDDIDSQGADNYTYDEIGNLKSDAQEEIREIQWTVYGKIKKVIRTTASTKDDLEFRYDASGNRVAKIVKLDGSSVENGGTDNPVLWTTTYYVRDASGNTMATYQDKENDANLYLQEQNIFGSSRVGVVNRNLNLTVPVPATNIFTHTVGRKSLELSNHLGNVLTVVSDRKLAVDNVNNTTGLPPADGLVDFYTADVVSTTDYYAFGSSMPGRNFTSNSYRYGFNGKEKDDEMKGSGNSYDFGARIYDPRIGRWLACDPLSKKYPDLSPYLFTENCPIWKVDKGGDSTVYYTEAGLFLFGSNDNLSNALVVIPDNNLIEFQNHITLSKVLGTQDAVPSNLVGRSKGTTYPIKSFRDFYSKFHGKAAKEDAQKYTEAGSALEAKGNVLNLKGPVAHANPKNVMKTQQQQVEAGDNPRIHTHPDAVPGSGFNPDKGPSGTDKKNAPGPDESFMNVMVRPDNVFIYNTRITLLIKPDIFKNPPANLTPAGQAQPTQPAEKPASKTIPVPANQKF